MELSDLLVAAITVTALFGIPGYVLARALIPRELDSLSSVVALSIVLGIGVQILPATALLLLHGSLATLVKISLGIVVLSGALLAWPHLRRWRETRSSPRSMKWSWSQLEVLTLRLVVGTGVAWVLLEVVSMASVRGRGDLWVYLSFVRSYLDLPHLELAGSFGVFQDARMGLSGWLVLQALIAQISGLDPVDLNSLYLPPIWTLVSLAGFLFLSKSVCRQEECALFCCGVQVLHLLSSFTRTVAARDPGFSLAVRINEDKIAVWLFLLPVTVALCLRVCGDVAERRSTHLAAVGLGVAALAFTHPVGIAILALSLGSYLAALLIRDLILHLRGEQTVSMELACKLDCRSLLSFGIALVALIAVGLAVPLIGRELLRDAGYSWIFGALTDTPAGIKMLYDRFMDVLPSGRYRASTALMDHPLIVLAFVTTPLLAMASLRDRGALFLLSNMWIPAALLYSSWTAPLIGSLVTAGQLWRLHWVWPISLAVGWVLYAALEKLQRWLRERTWRMRVPTRAATFLPLTTLLVLWVPLREDIRQGLWHLQQLHDHSRLEPERRALLEELGASVPPGTHILASPLMNNNIPAFVAQARTPTIRLKPDAVASQVTKWLASETVDTAGLELLRRHEVSYVVVGARTLLAAHLDRLTSMFSRSYGNASFVFYRVLSLDLGRSSGDSLFVRADLRSALDAYERDPSRLAAQAMVLNALGREQQSRGRLAAAIERYRQSASLDPTFVWPRLNLSRALLGQAALSGDAQVSAAAEEALRVLSEAFSIWPDHAAVQRAAIDGCRALGACRLDRGLLSRVLEFLEVEVARHPGRLQPHLDLAGAYGALGEIDKLIAVRRLIVKRWPSWGEAYDALARSLLLEGREDEARDAFEEARFRTPTLFGAYQSLIPLYEKRGRTSEILPWLERQARRNFRAWWPRWFLGRIYLDSFDDPQRAIPELERSIYIAPTIPWAYPVLDRAYREVGHLERAEAFYRGISLGHPDSPASAALVRAYIEEGKLQSALALLATRLDSTPGELKLYDLLVDALEAEGRGVDKLASVYEQAAKSNPGRYWPFMRRVKVYREHDRPEQAWTVAEEAASVVGEDRDKAAYLEELGRMALGEGKVEDALARFEAVVTLQPLNSTYRIRLGQALQASGNAVGAERALEAAARLSPLSSGALYWVGSLMLHTVSPAAALPYAERSARIHPNAPDSERLLAEIRAALESSDAVR